MVSATEIELRVSIHPCTLVGDFRAGPVDKYLTRNVRQFGEVMRHDEGDGTIILYL